MNDEELRDIRGKLCAVLDKWRQGSWAAYVAVNCYPKGHRTSGAAWNKLEALWRKFIWDSFYVIAADLEGPEALKAYLDKIVK